MQITCETCPVRDSHCADCMVTALLQIEPWSDTRHLPLDADERRAVDVLAGAGLISAAEATGARAVRAPHPLRSTG